MNVVQLCNFSFLGAFTKLQKVTISSVVSVCLSTWNNLAVTEQIFVKFDDSFLKIC